MLPYHYIVVQDGNGPIGLARLIKAGVVVVVKHNHTELSSFDSYGVNRISKWDPATELFTPLYSDHLGEIEAIQAGKTYTLTEEVELVLNRAKQYDPFIGVFDSLSSHKLGLGSTPEQIVTTTASGLDDQRFVTAMLAPINTANWEIAPTPFLNMASDLVNRMTPVLTKIEQDCAGKEVPADSPYDPTTGITYDQCVSLFHSKLNAGELQEAVVYLGIMVVNDWKLPTQPTSKELCVYKDPAGYAQLAAKVMASRNKPHLSSFKHSYSEQITYRRGGLMGKAKSQVFTNSIKGLTAAICAADHRIGTSWVDFVVEYDPAQCTYAVIGLFAHGEQKVVGHCNGPVVGALVLTPFNWTTDSITTLGPEYRWSKETLVSGE